jgi:LEA14-like dessication related protein
MIGQNRYFIIFLLVFGVFTTSCSLKPVELKKMDNIEIQNINNNVLTFKVSATINNPNSRLTLKNSEMFVYLKGNEMGKLTQVNKIIIDGKTTGQYSAILKFEFTNLKGGIMSALTMFRGGNPELKISGKVKVTAPFYWKTLTIKDYPIHL